MAFLSMENLTAAKQYNYLGGIISNGILYDLATADDIIIVERDSLESIIEEQELFLSDLSDSDTLSIGKILGADFLLKGQYVFLGEEIIVNISLIDVVTAETLFFSERGNSENLIHALSEKIIYKLTKKKVTLQNSEFNRSILSISDENMGSISLHTNLDKAEIYLDNELIGYTHGDFYTPVVIENVRPGTHTIRLHLYGYGIIKQPEISIHDWQEQVEVAAGKNCIVRANIKYDLRISLRFLIELTNEHFRIKHEEAPRTIEKSHKISFIDREGREISILFNISGTLTNGEASARATMKYNGTIYTLTGSCAKGNSKTLTKEIGIVKVEIVLFNKNRSYVQIGYIIERTDIDEYMWANDPD